MRTTDEPVFWCSLIIAFLFACNGRLIAQEPTSENWTAYKIEPPFAWNRVDRYEAPSFETFFPDDAEASKQLDLMLEGKLKVKSVEERLTVRWPTLTSLDPGDDR